MLCLSSVWPPSPLSAGPRRGAPRGFVLGAEYVTVVVVIHPSSRTLLCFYSLGECRKDKKTFKSSHEMLKLKAQSNIKYCNVTDLISQCPRPPGAPVTAKQLSRAVALMEKACELWSAGLGRNTTKYAGLFTKDYCKFIWHTLTQLSPESQHAGKLWCLCAGRFDGVLSCREESAAAPSWSPAPEPFCQSWSQRCPPPPPSIWVHDTVSD